MQSTIKRLRLGLPITALVASITVAACGTTVSETETADDALELTSTDASTLLLEQSWSRRDRDSFHRTSEGGTVFPLAWLKALEQPTSEGSLLDPAFARHFGVLSDATNPDGLPLGFTKTIAPAPDGTPTEFYGITCALCHTNEIAYRGKRVRIEGAGSRANVVDFIFGAVPGALVFTSLDPAKFDRFAHRVLGDAYREDTAQELRQAVGSVVEMFTNLAQVIDQLHLNPVPEGSGRIDAMGRVANFVFGPLDNRNWMVMNAPVSMPAVWGAEDFAWKHYTGAISQSMARDVVNAMAGGARASVDGKSTVDVAGLHTIESTLARLSAPRWPASVFGRLDDGRVRRGRRLYEHECASCHSRHEQPIVALDEIGTDATSARGIHDKVIQTGPWGFGELGFFDAAQKVSELVKTTKYDALGLSLAQRTEWDRSRPNTWRTPLGYKARALDGIWATAPYLHNGSVASLAELLLPAAERASTFYVGPNQEFDPTHVGYATASLGDGSAQLLDTHLTGNSNAGHEYGTGLCAEDRLALVEYLKTL